MPTTLQDITRCKKILAEIDEKIPKRGYVKMVQDLYQKKGLSIPTAYKIQAVRNGRVFDVKIMSALSKTFSN